MPRKGSRAATQPPPLVGCNIALSGAFPGTTHAAILGQITPLGASLAKSITDDATHLVTTQRDYDKPSTKVKAAREHNLHIVSLGWIEHCLSTTSKVPEKTYLFTSSPTDVSSQSSGSRKRNASPDSPSDENVKSQPKKQKTVNDSKTKVESGQVADNQIAKSPNVNIPLDEGCPLTTYKVYIDDDGVIYDASLNQTNATANNNKFYRIQVLAISQHIFRTLLTCRRFFKIPPVEITRPGLDGAGLANWARAQILVMGLCTLLSDCSTRNSKTSPASYGLTEEKSPGLANTLLSNVTTTLIPIMKMTPVPGKWMEPKMQPRMSRRPPNPLFIPQLSN
jgi:hypothetical protein